MDEDSGWEQAGRGKKGRGGRGRGRGRGSGGQAHPSSSQASGQPRPYSQGSGQPQQQQQRSYSQASGQEQPQGSYAGATGASSQIRQQHRPTFDSGAGQSYGQQREQQWSRGKGQSSYQSGPSQTQSGPMKASFSGESRERQVSEHSYKSSAGGHSTGYKKPYEDRNGELRSVNQADYIDPYKKPYDSSLEVYGWHHPNEENFSIQKYVGNPLGWKKEVILVSVNHFPLLSKGKKIEKLCLPPHFHQYRVEMEIIRERRTPAPGPSKSKGSPKKGGKEVSAPLKKELPKHLAQLILMTVIPQIQEEYNYYGIISDNRRHLYTPRKLEDVMDNNLMVELPLQQIKYIEEDEGNGTVRVSFIPTPLKIDTVAMANFFEEKKRLTLQGFPIGAMDKQTLEAALNAVVRSFPKFRYVSVGRSSLIPWQTGDGYSLGGGLVAWTGVSANIGMGWKPYLNVDIASCAFWLGKAVMEVLGEIFEVKMGYNDNWSCTDVTAWQEHKQLKAARNLNSCKVKYGVGGKILAGTVRNIPKESVSQKTFLLERENGQRVKISVYDYFVKERNAVLQNPNGPLLQLGETKFVPAELCIIKKGQSYNRRELMSDTQTTKMLKHAQRKPHELKTDILNQVTQLKLGDNKELGTLAISIPNKMLEMQARVLVAPNILYGKSSEGQVVVVTPTRLGHWETFNRGFHFYEPLFVIDKWAIFCLDGGKNDYKEFSQKLVENGRRMGMNFSPLPYVCQPDRNRDVRDFKPKNENITNLCKYFQQDFQDYKLVIVVLNKKNSELYGQVKHAAEVQSTMLTQCVVGRTILPDSRNLAKLGTTVQNILLKINSKLGGVNHVTVPPFDKSLASQFCNLLMECPILIMGADVTHPGLLAKGKDFAPSYAAVTASIDRTCMPFMTELRAQTKADRGAAEVIKHMEEITTNFLTTFEAACRTLPWKILYIRDGVGEGQFPELLHVEMTAIRKACTAVGGEKYKPKITFITAQKRHKTRIFHEVGNGKVEQAPPGTVVDKEIVHTVEMDFYLLSHHGLQGTSRPTRYHVLWDDSNFKPDHIQSMIYTLCYMYCRCTKSVSLPAPTYYAHLAADRAKKLCEGFEDSNRTVQSLNEILRSVAANMQTHPMYFV